MFIDQVFTSEWCPISGSEPRFRRAWQEHAGRIRRNVLSHSQIFNITNVADYLYHDVGESGWDLKRDFPRPMPPFRNLWCEWKFPKESRKERGADLDMFWIREFLSNEMGCLIQTRELDNEYGTPEAKWEIHFSPFMHPRGNALIGVFPQVLIGLNSDFMPISLGSKDVLVRFPCLETDEQKAWEKFDGDVTDEMINLTNVPLLAMSLLNCRNVRTKTIELPSALLRANQRRGKHITPEHHVIEIQPMVNRIRSMTSKSGYSRAAAPIIAGHFKDYRERGLFGKLKGIYWWDQRVKTAEVVEYRLKNAIGDLHPDWQAQESK